MQKRYALKIIQGTEDVIIIYFNDSSPRKNFIIALFSVRDQVKVSTWEETVDGEITNEEHYDDRIGNAWIAR